MKSFLEKIKKNRWHLHFLVMLPISYLFSSFFKFTLDGDLRGLEIVLLTTILSALVGVIWEFIHYYQKNTVFSVSDVIATALGGLVGSLIFAAITPNFNVGSIFFWVIVVFTIYEIVLMFISFKKLNSEKRQKEISKIVGKSLLYILLLMFVGFIQYFGD